MFAIPLPGCIPNAPDEVIVYCALDKEFSDEILKGFEHETGIKVLAKFDQESNKTVGLANEIVQQAENQRCDLFWNNEILHTLRLKRAGLLMSYSSSASADYPSQFVSPDSDWFGFAARARVFLVNTELLPDKASWPTSVQDLADPKWKGQGGIAKPLFGTTASHAAVLYTQLGLDQADELFQAIANSSNVESGNKQVAINVARGAYAFGLTDTDDAIIEIEAGYPVAMLFPDQGAEQPGTLLIPNTLGITKGPNSRHAKRLVDYLLQKKIEESLAAGRSAQIPLNNKSDVKSRVEPAVLKVMAVDFESAAENWEQIKARLVKIFPL